MTDCPQCPHPAADHGTYGCLHGWELARYTESIIQGCKCSQRGVAPQSLTALPRRLGKGHWEAPGWPPGPDIVAGYPAQELPARKASPEG